MRTDYSVQPEIEIDDRHRCGEFEPDKGNSGSLPVTSNRHPLYPAYFGGIAAVGTSVLLYCTFDTIRADAGLGWMVFAVLTFITAAFSLKLPKSDVRVSVPDVFIFSSILLFGPAIGALTAAMEGLMGSLRARTKSRRLHFAAFNMAAVSLSAFLAGKVRQLTFPQTAGTMASTSGMQEIAFSLVVLAVWYFVLNTGLLALLISLEKGKRMIDVWMECFSWLGIGYLAAALMAGILSITSRALDIFSVIMLAVVPLIAFMSYRQIIKLMAENTRLKHLQTY
jgi:hypothetical protein